MEELKVNAGEIVGVGVPLLRVLAIAGRFRTGRTLGLDPLTRAAFAMAGASVLLGSLPEMGRIPWPPGPPHLLPALLRAGAFLAWLADHWPAIRDPGNGFTRETS